MGYSIAFLIIIAATLVSVGRLLTPYLNEHRADFERWASQLLNAPVHMGDVRISWNAYVPQLTFSHVTILDNKTNKPNFDIRQIKINVKILESLIKREPILSYMKISGIDLTIHSIKGALNIKGFGDIAVSDNLLGGIYEANEVLSWVFSQPALGLADIHVIFYTRAGVKKSITLNELSLINSNNKHLLSGKGTLNQDIPTKVELALDWRGNNLELENIAANVYLYVEGVSLPQWFKQQTWKNLQIKEGLGSAKIWLDWNQGHLQQVQTQLQIYHLSMHSLVTHQTQTVTRLSGNFGWKRSGKNQVFAGNDILIDLPKHLWPMTSFSLTLPLPVDLTTKQDHVAAQVSYIDLADVSALAEASGLMPEHLTNLLQAFKPSGQITSLTLDFQNNVALENNKISGKFNELSLKSWEAYPGIYGLSGAISWNGKTGALDLDSKNIRFIYASAFNAPLAFKQLTGHVDIKKDKNAIWLVNSKKLALANDDLQMSMNVSAEIPKDESAKVDLTSTIEVSNANHLVRYFPIKKMEPDLSHWLLQAFHAGKFVEGKLVVQGRVNDFPYTQQNGKFSLYAEGKDLDFGYALGWPSMKKVNGTIQFSGRQMTAEIATGSLQGMAVKNLHIEIPYLGKEKPPLLLLSGAMEGNLAQGMQVIQHSPLNDKLSKEIMGVQVAGSMQLSVNAKLPIKTPELAAIKGDITLAQADISMPAWNMIINGINGVLHFTEKSIEAPQITAKLWGEPVTLQIHTDASQKAASFISMQMKGQISHAILQSFVKDTPYASIIHGGTDYQATIHVAQNQISNPMQLTINSDLKGITLNLPAGLGKEADDIVPTQLIANMKKNTPLEIMCVYGNKLSAAATIKNTPAGMQLYSGELRLGDKERATIQAEPGLLISGQFDTLDWNVWKSYFTDVSHGQASQSMNGFSALFRELDIRANKIIGLFQPIDNAHLQLSKSAENYILKLDSTDIAGEITLPIKSKDALIQADFERLYIAPLTAQKEPLDPNILPHMIFEGGDVRYQNKSLGRVSFEIKPIKHGVAIESMRMDSKLLNLTAKGEWLLANKKAETHLHGKMTTPNVAELLSSWGSPTVNPEDSSGTVIFDLNWPAALSTPALPSMTGQIDLELSSGQIINLDQATNAKMGFGRILNLLSLDSISRALTFNFKDLTEKGYSFDSIKGRFILKNGSAHTDDVRIEGPVARIEMSGRIGYVAKDYDIAVSVTPYVTGSIPVVAAIAVNPIVGIAAWAVEKLAGKAVSSATTHHYEVKGTWDKPKWVDR